MRNRREKKEKKRTSSGNPSAAGETPKFRITTLASGASDKLGVQNAVFGFSTTKTSDQDLQQQADAGGWGLPVPGAVPANRCELCRIRLFWRDSSMPVNP